MGTGISMANINQIKQYAEDKEYDKALALIRQQDLSKSYNSQFVRICGEVFLYTHNYEESRNALLMAHKMAPEGNRIIYDLIQLYLETGESALAEKYHEQYVFNTSEGDSGLCELAYMFGRSRRDSAEQLYEALSPLHTQDRSDALSYQFLLIFQLMGDASKFNDEYHYLFDNFRDSEYKAKAKHLIEYKNAASELYIYPQESILKHDDKIDANETVLLEQDYYRMYPKEPEIVLMADDYDAQDDQSIMFKLWAQKRREKAERRAAAKAEKKQAKQDKDKQDGKFASKEMHSTDDTLQSEQNKEIEESIEHVKDISLENAIEHVTYTTEDRSEEAEKQAEEVETSAAEEQAEEAETSAVEEQVEEAEMSAVEEQAEEVEMSAANEQAEEAEELSEEITMEDTYFEPLEEVEEFYEETSVIEDSDAGIDSPVTNAEAAIPNNMTELFMEDDMVDSLDGVPGQEDIKTNNDFEAFYTDEDRIYETAKENSYMKAENDAVVMPEVPDKHQQIFDEYDEMLKKEEAKLTEQFEREARLLQEAQSLLASVESGVDYWNSQKVNNLFEAFDMEMKEAQSKLDVSKTPEEEPVSTDYEAAAISGLNIFTQEDTSLADSGRMPFPGKTSPPDNIDMVFESAFESLKSPEEDQLIDEGSMAANGDDFTGFVDSQKNRDVQPDVTGQTFEGDMEEQDNKEFSSKKPHIELREHTKSMLTLDARKKDILQQLKERR